MSTPDTHPGGTMSITHQPFSGSSYMGMVTRGNLGPYALTTEDCQTRLIEPLVIDECYKMTIGLAFSDTAGHTINWGDDWLTYANPVFLKIWGGYNNCDTTEILWQSPPISHTDWKQYNSVISPKITDCNYLILEVEYVNMPKYFGNMLMDSMTLEVLPLRDTVFHTVKHSGELVQLYASEGVSYSWSPAVGLSCTDCRNPFASPQETTHYEVLITDALGCSYTEIFEIKIETVLYVPNVFSPNQDGANDLLFARVNGNEVTSFQFKIYDRWGEKVFESGNVGNGWDGIYNGLKASQGVYVYYVDLETSEGESLFKKGNVTLVR